MKAFDSFAASALVAVLTVGLIFWLGHSALLAFDRVLLAYAAALP